MVERYAGDGGGGGHIVTKALLEFYHERGKIEDTRGLAGTPRDVIIDPGVQIFFISITHININLLHNECESALLGISLFTRVLIIIYNEDIYAPLPPVEHLMLLK